MDYKELIERLVDCDQLAAAIEDDDLSLALEDAADAIETLLAERDAAVEALRYMGCDVCKYKKVDWSEEPCYSCHRIGGGKDGWKWRGPKKEGGSDG